MKTILYVEDDVIHIDRFLAAAKIYGHFNVLTETQGANALHKVMTSHPDLLIIDWELSINQTEKDPKTHDGIVVARRVHRSCPALPIIVLTNWSREEVEQHKRPEAIYLSKAGEWDPIFQRIAEILGKQ